MTKVPVTTKWRADHAVDIAVNDTGCLHPTKNCWLTDTTCCWEVAFVVWAKGQVVLVQFEPTKDNRALKPRGPRGGANHEHWKPLSEGASNDDVKVYQGFARNVR